MKKFICFLLCCVVILHISCSREKNIDEGIRLYNEGLTQSAYVKFKEGLVQYSQVERIDAKKIYVTPHAIFSSENLLTAIYPHKHDYNFPREVVSVWYNPDEDVCVATDGMVVYLSKNKKESIINNPSQEPIKAVAHAKHTYFLCGKELFIYTATDEQTKKFCTTEFAPPQALKYYNAYIDIVDDKLIVITGIAGTYNLWVLNTKGDVLLSGVRIASWKHFLHNDELYVIKGSAGNWDFKRIHIKTKQEIQIKSFSNVTDIHMTEHGCIINAGEHMYVYLYSQELYVFPFVYSVKGETRTSMVIDNGGLVLCNSEKFFQKIVKIAKSTTCCGMAK
ncbi:MAG: hypothetical protein N3F66_07270 [Spirochaetes bacterium]|nr:hypothetical protein [Spirochaetota bacterium]